MPTERLSMRRIRDLLRLKFAQGMSGRSHLPTTPQGWAIRLTQILSLHQAAHGLPRFPIDVAALAQDVSRQVFPDAPIRHCQTKRA
jgi:hypothetical protein